MCVCANRNNLAIPRPPCQSLITSFAHLQRSVAAVVCVCIKELMDGVCGSAWRVVDVSTVSRPGTDTSIIVIAADVVSTPSSLNRGSVVTTP